MQWHFGNCLDIHPTSLQMSWEDLRQGDAPASVYFKVLIARVHMKHIALLAGRGVVFTVAHGVKITSPACGNR